MGFLSIVTIVRSYRHNNIIIRGIVAFVQDKLFGCNALIYFIVLGCSFLSAICLKKMADGIKLILRGGADNLYLNIFIEIDYYYY